MDRTNKSSDRLENSQKGGDRFLMLLKMRGPQSSSDLGAALGISDEACRQQLVKLATQGLVESDAIANGVGRPQQVWRITPLGDKRFPDTHAELVVQLLQAIQSELGEDAMSRLIAAREAATRISYAAEMSGAACLADRIAKLAAIRTREGYMAEWQQDGDGFLLVENHCPICAAATACQGFCRAELQVFREVIGEGATIERVEHIPTGARRCAYRIRQAT
jgi:predicted ArsR family transcriptional regulator